MIKSVPRQINPNCIKIVRKIGSGQFGDGTNMCSVLDKLMVSLLTRNLVFEGELRNSGKKEGPGIPVAVKTIRTKTPSNEEVDDFLAEAALMVW